MYHVSRGAVCGIHLVVRPWVGRELQRKCFLSRTCAVFLIVRPSVGRLGCLLTCKALGETRVVGRGLRLDDV